MSDPIDIGVADPWDALGTVQHELCVSIPGMLLRLTPEDRVRFADYLVFIARETQKDPEAMAYSIG